MHRNGEPPLLRSIVVSFYEMDKCHHLDRFYRGDATVAKAHDLNRVHQMPVDIIYVVS